MQWSDAIRPPPPKLLRQFAVLVLVLLVAAGLFQVYWKGHGAAGWTLVALGAVLGIAGLVRPNTLRWVWTGWMVLAFPIGFAVSTLVLVFLFYVVFAGMGLVMRLTGRDALCLRRQRDRASLWEPKVFAGGPARYLRQY